MLSLELGLNLSPQDTEFIRQQAPKIAARLQTAHLPPEVKPVTFRFVVDSILHGWFDDLNPRTRKIIDVRVATGISFQDISKKEGVSRTMVGDVFKRGMQRLLRNLPEELQLQLMEQRVLEVGNGRPHSKESKEAIGKSAKDRWDTETFQGKIKRARTRTRKRQSLRKLWQDQNYRQRMIDTVTDLWQDPNHADAVRKAIQSKWDHDPKYRIRVIKGIERTWERDPEYREKIVAASSRNKQ